MRYQTAYLTVSLLALPVWVLLWWRAAEARREMWVMSGLFVLLFLPKQLLLDSRDWWHPLTLTGTRVGIEDVLYAGTNGGAMAVLFTVLTRRRAQAGALPRWPLAPLAVAALTPYLCGYAFGMHSSHGTVIGLGAALALLLAERRDLAWPALGNAVVVTAMTVAGLRVAEALYPGWIDATWDLPRLSGRRLLGVPVEDVAATAGAAALWGVYDKFRRGVRLVA